MISSTTTTDTVRQAALAARDAGARLAAMDAAGRSALLNDLAAALLRPETRQLVMAANKEDMDRARAENVATPLVNRLGLDDKKMHGLVDGLRQLAAQDDLVGHVALRRELDDGLVLERVSCPLGVLGVVFEARPEALIQIVGLALKSGNAVLLKGGSEAVRSNQALAAVVHGVLGAHGVDPHAATLLEGRAEVQALLGLHDIVDLIVARGSSEFVDRIRSQSRIPVMAHSAGICHIYLHQAADPAMSARIAVDSKCSYPAACNAAETLLWDPGAGGALDAAVQALQAAGVELRGCEATRARHPAMKPAVDADWDTEYGALILSIKQVSGLDAALQHIQRHGSRHTETIVTDDRAAAERFLQAVDASGVYHNASTRFSDGYRYGLGAEVGISTDKLHARGPVGVDGLLTYRWLLRGSGQITTEYGPGKKSFTHRTLPTG